MKTPNLELAEVSLFSTPEAEILNQAFWALDAIVQLTVLDKDLDAPPSGAPQGARYIIGRRVAMNTPAGWLYFTPRPGWEAKVADELFARYVYDGTDWAPVVDDGGGGGGGGNVTPDTHPGSPSLLNDEFEGTTLDAKWALLNSPTTNIADGSLLLTDASSTGDNIGGVEQTIPGTFRMWAKVAVAVTGGNDNRGGIYVRNHSNSRLLIFGTFYSSGRRFYVNRLTNETTISANVLAGAAGQAGPTLDQGNGWIYLEVICDGTNINFGASNVGVAGTYRQLYTEAAATFLGTPTRAGGYSDRSSAVASFVAFDFIRFS